MITARQAITSQYFPTQLWSVSAVAEQQLLVCSNSLALLGHSLSPTSAAVIWYNLNAETIGIDQVRQLQEQLRFSSGDKRFVFLLFADRLTLQAQHALLKLLEEPPANTQIVLVSNKPHALLSTIRSRCSERRVGGASDVTGVNIADIYTEWKRLSVSEAIKTAELYKKRDETLPIIEELVRFLRSQILPTATEKKELQPVLADIDHCLVALDQLAHNTNSQLVMESLLFHLNKHECN
jgi:hypothetical protein